MGYIEAMRTLATLNAELEHLPGVHPASVVNFRRWLDATKPWLPATLEVSAGGKDDGRGVQATYETDTQTIVLRVVTTPGASREWFLWHLLRTPKGLQRVSAVLITPEVDEAAALFAGWVERYDFIDRVARWPRS